MNGSTSRRSTLGALAAATMAIGAQSGMAQSINVDFNRPTGQGVGAPSAGFLGAAGQGGIWNAVVPSSAPGGELTAVFTADGTSSRLLKHKASFGAASGNNGSGDYAKLMADYAFGMTQNGVIELEFRSMEPGLYDIFVYTGLPQSEAYYTQWGEQVPHTAYISASFNNGAILASTTTAGWVPAPQFQQGVNYARFVVRIPEVGHLNLVVGADSSNSSAKVAVNGVQLCKWPTERLHVKPTATGTGHGRDWANATGNLHGALDYANQCAGAVPEVWLAGGTYKPAASDRTASFRLPGHGVVVRGGFAGTETSPEQRSGAVVTTLSGNIGNIATPNDNSYTVVRAEGVTAHLDRVTIRDGRATGGPGHDRAGGLVALGGNVTVTDSLFVANIGGSGGGAYGKDGELTIRNCEFVVNGATNGGAIAYQNAAGAGVKLFVTDSRFEGNIAAAAGGAISRISEAVPGSPPHLGQGMLWIERCEFVANGASSLGGAVYSLGGNLMVNNSLVNGNVAEFGGGVYHKGRTLWLVSSTVVGNHAASQVGGVALEIVDSPGQDCQVTSSILHGNTAGVSTALEFKQILNFAVPGGAGQIHMRHSCIEGNHATFDGFGNTSADPQFVDRLGPDGIAGTWDDNLRLRSTSPLIDAGIDAMLYVDTDLDGSVRRVDIPEVPDTGTSMIGAAGVTYIDIGCYEFQGAADPTCVGDLNGDGAVDGADLGMLLAAWGGAGVGDLDGNGVINGADLGLLLAAWGVCN